MNHQDNDQSFNDQQHFIELFRNLLNNSSSRINVREMFQMLPIGHNLNQSLISSVSGSIYFDENLDPIEDSEENLEDIDNSIGQHIEYPLELIGEVVVYNQMAEYLKKNFINCSICSEPYKQESQILITECFHNFCYECINTWINTEKKNNCPMCRNKFF
jgi:hypothetical protein